MTFDPDTYPVASLKAPANVLITGASSGIGHALLRQLLVNRHVNHIFAVSRSATSHQGLAALQVEYGQKLQRIDADITNEDDLARLADATRTVDAIHLVINAAGVLHRDAIEPEKAIEQASKAALEQVFAINAFAPLLLAKALMPQLCRGQPAVFASLSARVGSIGDNRAGGWYAYRASKAAQNQLMKTFAIEWRRRNPVGTCLLLHPGTVDTALSAPFQARVPAERLFDPQRAAAQLLRIIADSTPADSGRFLAWDGNDIPW
ncbi:MAG: SDR family NAD(P)-dependent oxidoreductase [Pseudomonadota bacterium]|nr:SDR family NAD(P)-dependent oxidoreductase [Pseudomonadota bacterium]MDQ3160123.1 SDR family NAD(P)-dependent oxidoreductase [Pseudomonadota bacterium]